MTMNDIIIGNIERGSFRFRITFEMFGIEQVIEEATFDTGCSHSLISVKSLNIGDANINELELDALLDKNVMLTTGAGVESKGTNFDKLKTYVQKINKWKRELQEKNTSDKNARAELNKQISNEMKNAILGSRNIRYSYIAYNYEIDAVCIGNFKVHVSFNLTKANLIGMHIIKKLYTKIFPEGDRIFLLAKRNSPLANAELDIVMEKLRKELKLPDSASKSISVIPAAVPAPSPGTDSKNNPCF